MAGEAIGQDLLSVPMGDLIRQMAFAIADAQLQLDFAALRTAEVMSGQHTPLDEKGEPKKDGGGKVVTVDTRVYFGKDKDDKPELLSLIELGFAPTFYQFIDTLIEVKIAVKVTRSTDFSASYSSTAVDFRSSSGVGFSRDSLSTNSGYSVSVTTVDAAYAAKYNYSAEGASLLRTKMVPVPPPAILGDRIRRLLDQNKP